ncbi:hypothetical protein ACQP1V_36755 [Microtetraspora malaysiensis]|uniref:hypothetical protein n=1 Tax=Microtetraspora malaysiensis TaxID=161358 RepID=UPI003D912929
MVFTVVYDACVLYPSTLRDLLIRIAQAGIVQAKWTQQILEQQIADSWRNPPGTAEDVLASLERSGLVQSVAELRAV